MHKKAARLSQNAQEERRTREMLNQNAQSRLVEKDEIKERHHQEHTGVRVPRTKAIHLERAEDITAIDEAEERGTSKHHCRQSDPGSDDPNPQVDHVRPLVFVKESSRVLSGIRICSDTRSIRESPNQLIRPRHTIFTQPIRNVQYAPFGYL